MKIDQDRAASEAVERAVLALRRGEAVLIASGGVVLPVMAAELADSEHLAGLPGPLLAYLTHARALTLKIRLYTAEAVAVPLGKDDPAGMARHLADPTLDIAAPLSGPFRARRAPLPPQIPAALRLLKLAGLLPAAIAPAGPRDLVPGERADLSAEDIDLYPARALGKLSYVTAAALPLADAPQARIVAFRPGDGGPESLAIIVGEPDLGKPVLVRLHSECFTGDLLGSLKCDCGDQLRGAIRRMSADGSGILLYLAQEGRGIGLMNKLRAYALQDQGYDTMEANERLGFAADERVFDLAAAMLKMLGVKSVRLLTNNPDKVEALKTLGIDVAERVAHAFPSNAHNERYLMTKAKKGGHTL